MPRDWLSGPSGSSRRGKRKQVRVTGPEHTNGQYIPKKLAKRLVTDEWDKKGRTWQPPGTTLYRRPGSQNPRK